MSSIEYMNVIFLQEWIIVFIHNLHFVFSPNTKTSVIYLFHYVTYNEKVPMYNNNCTGKMYLVQISRNKTQKEELCTSVKKKRIINLSICHSIILLLYPSVYLCLSVIMSLDPSI